MATVASAAESSPYQGYQRVHPSFEEHVSQIVKESKRFYIIGAVNKVTGISANPFAINKTIDAMVCTVKSVKRLQSGLFWWRFPRRSRQPIYCDWKRLIAQSRSPTQNPELL